MSLQTYRLKMKWIVLAGYFSTIPLANFFITHIGKQYQPNAPHLIPVGFGYEAPSGVLLIGIGLVLRDLVQDHFGKRVSLIVIVLGVLASYAINPDLAVASAVAFGLSELFDLLIYMQIRKVSRVFAVIVSGLIGGVIDTFIFLQIAFSSTDFWQGQVIGKSLMAFLGGLILWRWRDLSNRMHTKEQSNA